jgi:isoquinoline 1-oxidoreductase beta subunit
MEPLNCTVKIDGDHCEIWTGTQFQTGDQGAAARILGTTPDKVTIHTTFLGGLRSARHRPDFVPGRRGEGRRAGQDGVDAGRYSRWLLPARVRSSVQVRPMRPMPAWDHVVTGNRSRRHRSPRRDQERHRSHIDQHR